MTGGENSLFVKGGWHVFLCRRRAKKGACVRCPTYDSVKSHHVPHTELSRRCDRTEPDLASMGELSDILPFLASTNLSLKVSSHNLTYYKILLIHRSAITPTH
jgi:hypothetical protein